MEITVRPETEQAYSAISEVCNFAFKGSAEAKLPKISKIGDVPL
jgi:predicted N-acetyltransferase YhbS